MELNEGDRIEIDVRGQFMGDPVWVPAVFVEYVSGGQTSNAGDMIVRIDAPEGHPWHRHNSGPLHKCPAHHYVRRTTS